MKKALRLIIALSFLSVGAVSSLAYTDVVRQAQVPKAVSEQGMMVLCGSAVMALAIYSKRRNN